MNINAKDREYLDILRGASILRVMLAHLGLSWFFIPYTQYISIFLPVFFFVSGAVTYNSIVNSKNQRFFFINRYITLISPFLIFSLPFLLTNIASGQSVPFLELIKLLFAWPRRDMFPFDMRQIWFINALILMFFISYPIFKIARKSFNAVIIAFIVSLIYVPIMEIYSSASYWREFHILMILDIPMQTHQVLSLLNYYFFGAIFYHQTYLNKPMLKISCLACFLLAFYFHLQIESFDNMRELFFSRGIYFTLLSYGVIFLLLIYKNQVNYMLNKLKHLKILLLKLSINSYSLFLIHTSVILVFEIYLGFYNVGDSLILGVIKMMGVVAVSIVVAPYLTRFNNLVVNKLKRKQ